MKKLLAKIRKILHDRRTRQMLTRIVSVTAAIVVFITTYALVLPAITMESEANCGIEAHQHDESCYEDKLICGEIESPGHHHSEACYEVSKALVCEEKEHQHDDSCFDESGNLTCDQLEHTHDDTCYKESRELTCDIPESDGHQHSSACYERVLTCGKEIHTHSTACYDHASDSAASAPADFAAVATTELGSSGATVSASTEIETESGESDAASSETSDAWTTEKNVEGEASSSTTTNVSTTAATTAGSSSTAAAAANTATASTGNTAFDSAAAEDTYIPQLEPVIFEQLLTKDTGIYYYHAEEGQEAPESSADIADWKRVNDDTELTPADLLRVYLRYTIPAGTLNATNDIARYRLPSNLHLTDQQMETINTTVNGVANQYVSLDTLEITDIEKYNTYLGIEATEGNRKPSDDVDDYFANHPDLEGQEYINAVVRTENVIDDTTGEYAGQDLVFTFSPYTVQKNQHEYDADGQPTKAGQKVDGWLCFDLHMDQIDWSEPVITTTDDPGDPVAPAQGEFVETAEDSDSSDTTETIANPGSETKEEASAASSDSDALNTSTLIEKKESSAEIIFAAKDKALKIDRISTELHLVEFNAIEAENDATLDEQDQSSDDSTDSTKSEMTNANTADGSTSEGEADKPESADETTTGAENQPELETEVNAETYPAVSFEDTITVQAGTLTTDNESAAQDTPAETVITVSVIAEEETFPLGTTMQLGTVEDMDTVASAVEGAVGGQTRGFHAVDISFHNSDGEEIEPLKPIKVSMTSDAIKQAVEDSSTAPIVVHLENPTNSNHTDSPDRAGDTKENSADNSSSGIPGTDESASLDTPVSAPADENADINANRPQVDTTINAPVATIIETTELTSEENSANKKETPDTLSFDAGSFSVYAIVYTVDFHYEVDGKKYEFSIPGGGFVSLEHIVEVLGIASAGENTDNKTESRSDFVGEVPGVDVSGKNGTTYEEAVKLNEIEVSEATMRFVNDVENVEFSSPELVWVGRVDEASTVGEIKDSRGVEVEYSAELTEEQIAEINAQTVGAGDWALVSVQPFTSEESLTVTMKNGDKWTVRVTDAQVTDGLTSGDKYLIYYTSGYYNYVLKNDGTITRVDTRNANNMDKLGDEYLWQFDHYNRFGDDYSLIHNGGTYITLNGTVTGITSNIATPTYMEAIGNGDFRLYGIETEWVQTGYWPWDGYIEYHNHYLTFNNNNFILADNQGGNTNIKLWKQEERKYNFTVKTEYSNVYRGTVSGIGADGTTHYNKVPSYVSITNKEKSNAYAITAVPSQGYHFKEWRLGETVLSGFTSPEIPAGRLTFPEDNMILTAVFEKDAGSSGSGETDYAAIINAWKEKNLVSEMNLDKTAHVYDYDNRIYEVDFTASGKATVIAPNLQLAFVTDVSRSMYFPAGLSKATTYSTTTNNKDKPSKPIIEALNNLKNQNYAQNNSGDGDDVYYLIADPENTSTVYAVRYDSTAKEWMYIDASFDIRKYPKKGATQGSDEWHIKNAKGNEVGWRALSGKLSSTNDNNCVTFNNGHLQLEFKNLDGNIYVANDVRYRLDYLQQAVDAASEVVYAVNQGAEIGLVTFAGSANDPHGLFGKDNYGELLTYLHDISPDGGTNQKDGLDKALQFWDTEKDPDHNRVVIMVTDGAPNAKIDGNNITWNQIANSAKALHDQKDATVHTVGLSIENVYGAKEGLADTAKQGGNGKSFSAKNSEELVNYILDIIKLYLKEANLKGTLHDDIDRAFYPVKQDGTPITPGFYDVNGTSITLETVQSYNDVNSNKYGTEYYLWKNNGGQWSITRYNIEFGKGTTNSPATQRNIYLKAREDFMGGNKINTNVQEAHAIGSNAVIRTGSNTVVKPMDKVVDAMAETPHVNVDELHLTEHSTDWTVYLGTEVTPKEQLKTLWDNIKVKQVIKEIQQAGSQDSGDVSQMKDKDQMWYAHGSSVDEADEAAPLNSDDDAKLPLSHYGLDNYYNALLAAITSGTSYDSGNIPYKPYGHDTVGNFKITATKEIVSGAVDATGKAPNRHVTDKAALPAETYKITVTYTPLLDGANTQYSHTTANKSAGKITTGSGNDEVKSENLHVINVIKKGIEIRKYDENNTLINDRPAIFSLYRPAQAGETGMMVEGVGDGYVKAATLTTSNGLASLAVTAQELRALPEGQHYYLVETQAPSGYVKLSSPIQIDISVTPGMETKPYKETENIDDLINVGKEILPTASIVITNANAELLSDSNGRFSIKVTNKAASVDININKVNEKNEPLPDAVFKLTNGASIVSIATGDTGVVVEPKVLGQTVTIENNTFTIPEGGVTIKNLMPSENIYSIVEVSPPAGYVISNNTPVTFKVTAGNLEDVQYIKDVTYTPASGTTEASFKIPNEPGAALPNTGGPGTTALYFLGIMLTAFAGAGLMMRKRSMVTDSASN